MKRTKEGTFYDLPKWLDSGSVEFDVNNKQMVAYLKTKAPVVDLLRQAATRPGCNIGIDYNPPSIFVKFPSLQKLKIFARLLSASSCAEVQEGRLNDAMENCNVMFRMADHLSRESTVITVLVSISIEMKAFAAFQYILEQEGLTRHSLDGFHIDPFLNFNNAIHRSFRMEAAFGKSAFAMLDSPEMEECLEISYSPVLEIYNVFLWKTDSTNYSRIMRRYEKISSRPYYETVKERTAMKEELDINHHRIGGMITSYLTPSLWRAADLAAVADARHRLMELGVAMWRYRLDEGAFPDELNLLTPKYLQAVPIDPFTGESLKTTRMDGKTVIYSVGMDLKDDGGKEGEDEIKSGDIRLVLGK